MGATIEYLREIRLPNPRIEGHGHVSRSFLKAGILTLWEAIEFVHKLPYGRTTNRENYLQILDEKRGACSGKHALIAALAQQLHVPLKLTLGIFLLTSQNTPKIAAVLEYYCLQAIPEAHCYLEYNKSTLDITFPHSSAFSFKPHLEAQMNISPEHIGSLKVEKHQAFIKKWINDKLDLNFDFIWTAREACIRKLME